MVFERHLSLFCNVPISRYHMHGFGIGSLIIYQIGENEEFGPNSRILTVISGPHPAEWLEERLVIFRADNRVKVREI